MRELRYALRMLVKAPIVTGAAVLSLALGIGANTAIFSLLHQILLAPLPVTRPGELVNLAAPGPKPGSTSCGQAGGCDVVFSYPMYRDLEKQQTVFTGLAMQVDIGANLSYGGETMNGRGVLVSGSYFPALGLSPALGRLFGPSDDATLDAPRAVVLAYDYWTSHFGSDPTVIGRPMIVNGQTMTIVGIGPHGFDGTTLGVHPDIFAPITARALLQSSFHRDDFENRRYYWGYVFGRLRSGVSIDQASAAVNAQYRPILQTVEAPLQKNMSDATLARFKTKTIVITPGAHGQSSLPDNARAPLLLLFTLTAVVVLIACANIANLLLARGVARSAEMAIRLSIGAARRHLVVQLLTESLMVAFIGGAAGLLVARLTLAYIASVLPNADGAAIAFTLDGAMLAFAAAAAVVTGLLFGLFPALHATRPNLATTLKNESGRTSSTRSARWFRSSLVSAQVAFSTLLLIMAALFTRSLLNVSRVDLGIRVDRLITFTLEPRLSAYTPERSRVFFGQIHDALATLPGVDGVGESAVPILGGSNWGTSVGVDGFQAGPDTDTGVSVTEISPGFFKTVGTTVIAGREFTAHDDLDAPKVAIVNHAFAKKFNLGNDAVGKHMTDHGYDATHDIEIVGLVEDAKYADVKQATPPLLYQPYRADKDVGNLTFYVRTDGDPTSLLRAIPSLVARFDARLPVEMLRTMSDQVRSNTFLDRMLTTLATAFAVVATLLAAVGLYGVLAYTVSRRTREFGLRMALGLTPGGVYRLVLVHVARLSIVGSVVGIGLSLVLGPAAASLLFQMKGGDPALAAAAAALVLIVAGAAGLVPALRAARVDPMQALRHD